MRYVETHNDNLHCKIRSVHVQGKAARHKAGQSTSSNRVSLIDPHAKLINLHLQVFTWTETQKYITLSVLEMH